MSNSEWKTNINNKVGNKQHWIKKTKIAEKCRENESIRKGLSIIIVISTLLCIILFIVSLSKGESLKIQAIMNNTKQKEIETQIMFNKIRMVLSPIIGIVVFYYGSKIVQKED